MMGVGGKGRGFFLFNYFSLARGFFSFRYRYKQKGGGTRSGAVCSVNRLLSFFYLPSVLWFLVLCDVCMYMIMCKWAGKNKSRVSFLLLLTSWNITRYINRYSTVHVVMALGWVVFGKKGQNKQTTKSATGRLHPI